jgi:Trk K+ transport system NAD-binding subunit
MLVVSDWQVGATLATDLEATVDVHVVTDSEGVAGRLPATIPVTTGDVTALETLADVTDATAAVVALRRDRQAVLVVQLLRTHLDTEDIVAVVNDPQRHDAFDGIATTTVCGSSVLAAELGRVVETVAPSLE